MFNKEYWWITRIDDELKIRSEVGITFKVMPTIKKMMETTLLKCKEHQLQVSTKSP